MTWAQKLQNHSKLKSKRTTTFLRPYKRFKYIFSKRKKKQQKKYRYRTSTWKLIFLASWVMRGEWNWKLIRCEKPPDVQLISSDSIVSSDGMDRSHSLWKCKMVEQSQKTHGPLLQHWIYPITLHPGVERTETVCLQKDLGVGDYSSSVCELPKLEHPRCPSVHEQLKKLCGCPPSGHYSPRIQGVFSCEDIGDWQGTMLCEKSHYRRYHMVWFNVCAA